MSMKSLKKQQTLGDRGQISGMPGSFLTDIRQARCAVLRALAAGEIYVVHRPAGDRDKAF